MNEYQIWSEGLTEDAVRMTGAHPLDSTTESHFTSLLYGDNDVVNVMVKIENERCVVSDGGDAEWTARMRHLGAGRFTADERSKAQAIAGRRDVVFQETAR